MSFKGLLSLRDGETHKWWGSVLRRALRKFGALEGVLARVLLLIFQNSLEPNVPAASPTLSPSPGIQHSSQHRAPISLSALSGPVRDTPPYCAIPFQDSIAEGGIAPICLVFIGYRASIAEIPLFCGGGGIAPPLRMLSKGKRLRKGGGVSHPIGDVETPKTP